MHCYSWHILGLRHYMYTHIYTHLYLFVHIILDPGHYMYLGLFRL